MKKKLILLIILLSNVVFPLFAKPIDRQAAAHLKALHEVFQKNLEDRNLNKDKLTNFVNLLKEDNFDRKLISILALAYANDEDSKNALYEITTKANDQILKGAAFYALTIRNINNKNRKLYEETLLNEISKAKNAFTRMFLINRLFVDFGTVELPFIKQMAEKENNEMVKSDMLYYLSFSNNRDRINEILKINWSQNYNLPENISSIMNTITPGRSGKRMENNNSNLIDKLRKKLK
jgi:hypothetical protein